MIFLHIVKLIINPLSHTLCKSLNCYFKKQQQIPYIEIAIDINLSLTNTHTNIHTLIHTHTTHTHMQVLVFWEEWKGISVVFTLCTCHLFFEEFIHSSYMCRKANAQWCSVISALEMSERESITLLLWLSNTQP